MIAAASEGIGAWSVTSARVTGTSHQKTGTPCQDDGLWRTIPGSGDLVLVVSDGAGSGRLTQDASAAAVRSCSYALENWVAKNRTLTLHGLKCAANQAADDVYDLCRRAQAARPGEIQLRDFACTLVLVVLSGSKLRMLQIGDGAVVVETEQGFRCLTPPFDREFANETEFLVTPQALANPFTLELDASGLKGVAVMSDGVQNIGLEYPNNTPHPGLFRPLFHAVAAGRTRPQTERDDALNRFLGQDFISESNDDDKTLILAIREVN